MRYSAVVQRVVWFPNPLAIFQVRWGPCLYNEYKYHYIQLFIHYHGETTNPATTSWLIWKERRAQYKVIARVPLYQILSDRYKIWPNKDTNSSE